MATQKKDPTPAAKARTCAVNTPRWSALIPDQQPCQKPLAKPTAALCARHEKMLPDGWRKLDAENTAARVAARAKARAKTDAKPAPAKATAKPKATKAEEVIEAIAITPEEAGRFATPELAATAAQKRAASKAGAKVAA